MLHIVPVTTLIIFVLFIEFRLKQEFNELRRRLTNLERKVKELHHE